MILELNDIVPPAQEGLLVAEILMVGVTPVITVIVTAFEVTADGVAQTALDVSTQVTTSPSFNADDE